MFIITDCPANEIYKECSLEVCYKTCEHLKNPPPCPSIAAGCYLPSCECKDDYLRNENGVCVPYKECCKYNFLLNCVSKILVLFLIYTTKQGHVKIFKFQNYISYFKFILIDAHVYLCICTCLSKVSLLLFDLNIRKSKRK